jgi:hypothetical protein
MAAFALVFLAALTTFAVTPPPRYRPPTPPTPIPQTVPPPDHPAPGVPLPPPPPKDLPNPQSEDPDPKGVPEPASLLSGLVGGALALLAYRRSRRMSTGASTHENDEPPSA